tara:strand:- start:104 stop:277 length:174 start_codon:yes stop_codon:yes gene_type:complete
MDLPINDEELSRLVWWTSHMHGEDELHKKLKLVKEVRDMNPGGPYKKILREDHGMVI